MTPWQEGVRVTTVKDKVPGYTCELLSLPTHYRDLILHYPTLSISASAGTASGNSIPKILTQT